jgi:hypothetical protein
MLMINWDFVYVIARICVDGSMPCSSVARTPKEPVAPYASRRQDAGFCLVACKLAQRSIALSFSPDASNSQLLCALCSLDAFVHSFRGSIEITKRKRNVWHLYMQVPTILYYFISNYPLNLTVSPLFSLSSLAIDGAYRRYSKGLSIVVDCSKLKVALALPSHR